MSDLEGLKQQVRILQECLEQFRIEALHVQCKLTREQNEHAATKAELEIARAALAGAKAKRRAA